jgi:hypothetical protein
MLSVNKFIVRKEDAMTNSHLKSLFWMSGMAIMLTLGWLSAATAEEACPCFSAQELKDQNKLITDLAAAEGETTRGLLEVQFLRAVEVEGEFEVQAVEPFDTFTFARAREVFGLPGVYECQNDVWIEDVQQLDVFFNDLEIWEAQACVQNMLKAFEKQHR